MKTSLEFVRIAVARAPQAEQSMRVTKGALVKAFAPWKIKLYENLAIVDARIDRNVAISCHLRADMHTVKLNAELESDADITAVINANYRGIKNCANVEMNASSFLYDIKSKVEQLLQRTTEHYEACANATHEFRGETLVPHSQTSTRMEWRSPNYKYVIDTSPGDLPQAKLYSVRGGLLAVTRTVTLMKADTLVENAAEVFKMTVKKTEPLTATARAPQQEQRFKPYEDLNIVGRFFKKLTPKFEQLTFNGVSKDPFSPYVATWSLVNEGGEFTVCFEGNSYEEVVELAVFDNEQERYSNANAMISYDARANVILIKHPSDRISILQCLRGRAND